MPVRHLILPILLIASLAACDNPQETPKSETPPPPAVTDDTMAADVPAALDMSTTYSCPDGQNLVVRFHGDRADFDLSGQTYSLPQVVSASGTRYSDDKVTLWNKGNEIVVTEPGKADAICISRTY